MQLAYGACMRTLIVEADTLPSMSPVGTNTPRTDGPAKVTGDALYVDDIRPAGCLYGATIRATVAHGTVRSISQDPDFDWTDITLVTAKDIPGKNLVYLMTEDQPALVEPVGVERSVLAQGVQAAQEPVQRPWAPGSRQLQARAAQQCSQPDVCTALWASPAYRAVFSSQLCRLAERLAACGCWQLA